MSLTTSKYVLVQMSSSDLYATVFDDYEEAKAEMESNEEKAYIIRIENVCIESGFKLDLECHT